MVCVRCGCCCIQSFVVIVDDPALGITEENLKQKEDGPCQHLVGDEPGAYACGIQDEPWYKQTPCYTHGQTERDLTTKCRLGVYMLHKMEESRNEEVAISRD